MEKEKADVIKDIINKLRLIDYIKPEEIPNIELYMDQVTKFMDEHLSSLKRFEDDKMLTKTMINNYTKNDLLPSPEKKKYSKEHMLMLIYIYYFKNVLLIGDIQKIVGPLKDKFYNSKTDIKLEDIYNETFKLEKIQSDAITKDIVKKINLASDAVSGTENDEEREFLSTFYFICLMSFDIYIKKTIIEKMIDNDALTKFINKDEKGKDKSKEKQKEKSKDK